MLFSPLPLSLTDTTYFLSFRVNVISVWNVCVCFTKIQFFFTAETLFFSFSEVKHFISCFALYFCSNLHFFTKNKVPTFQPRREHARPHSFFLNLLHFFHKKWILQNGLFCYQVMEWLLKKASLCPHIFIIGNYQLWNTAALVSSIQRRYQQALM